MTVINEFFMSTDNGQRHHPGGGVTVINEIIFLTEEQKDMFFLGNNIADVHK